MEELLRLTKEDKIDIYKQFNTTEEKIMIDVGILKNWYKQQLHFPQDCFNETIIRNFLLRNKCRVEKAKEKIDCYYSMKNPHKHFFESLENIVPTKHITTYLPLPVLAPNKCRVILMKTMDTNVDNFDILNFYKINVAYNEILLREDHISGIIMLFDFKGYTFDHVKKSSTSIMAQASTVIEGGFSWRVSGVHYLNIPSFFNIIMAIVRKIVNPKIIERTHTHENLESLHKMVSPSLLPEEYGGTLGTIPELLNKWDKAFDERRDMLCNTLKEASDETKRIGKSKFDFGYGIDGTFKKLDID